MGDLVALNHAASFDYGEPDAEVVEKLEWLLEEAKSGNIRGMVYGVVGNERWITNGYCGSAENHAMVAVAAKVFHQIMAADATSWE